MANVYDIVTERICKQLSEGIIPWEKPWLCIRGERVGGWSHKTGTSYSLVNQLMLPSEGEYITFRQIRDEGGQLKQGATGYPIVFWKNYTVKVKNPDTNVEEDQDIPCLRYYTVYRIEDCEGITPNFSADHNELDGCTEPQRCKAAEAIIAEYIKTSGVKLVHSAQDRAYYTPFTDTVTLPLKKQFGRSKKAEYYSTAFHELIHSTGHRDRLNRLGTDTSTPRVARGASYSLEELVAEIGACSILHNLRLETKASIKNSNAYCLSWLQVLHNDTKMLVKAAGRAQKAVRYIYEGPDGLKPHGDWKPVKPVLDDGSHDTLPWD